MCPYAGELLPLYMHVNSSPISIFLDLYPFSFSEGLCEVCHIATDIRKLPRSLCISWYSERHTEQEIRAAIQDHGFGQPFFGGRIHEIILECWCQELWNGHMHGWHGKTLIRIPEVKIPSRKPWLRCEDNIKMDLKELCCEGLDWIHLVHDRNQWQTLVNTVMGFWVP